MDAIPLPDRTVLGQLEFGDEALVEPGTGASGQAWTVDEPGRPRRLLRVDWRSEVVTAREEAARAAAGAGIVVPRVLRQATLVGRIYTVYEWLPGRTGAERLQELGGAGDLDGLRALAREMGRLQRRLHSVAAPAELPRAASDTGHDTFTSAFDSSHGVPGIPTGDAVLHLDWHPQNLLVPAADEDNDGGTAGDTASDAVAGVAISGVIDWQNARRGHPALDLARTYSILTIEPSLAQLPADIRAALVMVRDAWAEGYGPEASAIPAACLAWSGRAMLADVGHRPGVDAEAVASVEAWTRQQYPQLS